MFTVGPRSFRILLAALTWLLLVPLAIDQTDVLDLCVGTTVVHDDGEISAPVGSGRPDHSILSGLNHASSDRARVLYDQDSPSPLPPPISGMPGYSIDAAGARVLPVVVGSFSSPLYLLHRAFLL